jgi:hypothetical protein
VSSLYRLKGLECGVFFSSLPTSPKLFLPSFGELFRKLFLFFFVTSL